MAPLFSLIIPTYRCFSHMDRCLSSVAAQTFRDFEVIFVDDASKDGTADALRAWGESMPFPVHVEEQVENRGPGVARNTGLRLAEGQYVTFLDADDEVDVDLLAILSPYADGRYDTLVFDASRVAGGMESPLLMSEKRGACGGPLDPREAFVFVRGCTVGKVYRRAFLKEQDLQFATYYRGEDVPFTKSALACSQTLYYIQRSLYRYFMVENSITHRARDPQEAQHTAAGIAMVARHIEGRAMQTEQEAWHMRAMYPAQVRQMIEAGAPAREIRAYLAKTYSRAAMKNPYIRQYPRSRYLLMWVLSTRCLPLIRLMYRYIEKKKM